MSQLSINLNLVAALREIRHHDLPDPAQAAVLAELGGADGVTVQVRRDRRLIRDRDLYMLNGIKRTRFTVEMPPAEEIISRMLDVKPTMVTLVADHADTASPVSPIDFGTAQVDFRDLTARFDTVNVEVGYFVDPEPDGVKGAAKAGAQAVLIDCSGYTGSRDAREAQAELDRIDAAGRAAAKYNLAVHLGRGITYKNIRPLIELGYIDEFSVGHTVCARAMLVGMEKAVGDMLRLVQAGATQA